MASETIYRVCVSRGRYTVNEYVVYDSGHERFVATVADFDNEPDAQADCDIRNTEQHFETSDYPTG